MVKCVPLALVRETTSEDQWEDVKIPSVIRTGQEEGNEDRPGAGGGGGIGMSLCRVLQAFLSPEQWEVIIRSS